MLYLIHVNKKYIVIASWKYKYFTYSKSRSMIFKIIFGSNENGVYSEQMLVMRLSIYQNKQYVIIFKID